MNIRPQHIRLTVWTVAMLTSAALVFMAFNMYPVPDGDAIYFFPTIKSYISTGVLENKLLDLSFDTDPAKQGKFFFYTPGFPLAVGSIAALLGLSTYKGILLVLSIIRAASVLLFTQSLIIFAERHKILASPFYGFILSMLVVGDGLFLFASNGRPEILSGLIISAALLAALTIHTKIFRHLALCLCIGLLFPVSLANGIIASTYYLFYLLSDIRKPAIRIAFLASALLAGGLIFVLSYPVAGIALADGLNGLAVNSNVNLKRSDTSPGLLLSYSKTWITFGMLALASLVPMFCSDLERRTRLSSVPDRIWLATSLATLGYAIYFFGLRAAPTHYNFYAFLPLYQLLSLQLLQSSETTSFKLWKYSLIGVMSMALLLSLADPLRTALLTPYYLSSGATYKEASNQFNNLETGRCSLMFTSGLFVLDESQRGSHLNFDDKSQVILSQRIRNLESDRPCLIAVVQEVNSRNQTPADMEMIADFGDASPWTSRLKALGVLQSPKGYSFRAYRKDLPTP